MFIKRHQWIGSLLLAVSITALTACNDDTTPPATDITKNSALTSNSKRIIVSDQGVGPITPKTPFNIHTITVAFPDYSVVEQLNFQEGESYPEISVSKGIKTLLTLHPTVDLKSIFSVVVEDNIIANALNHRLGTLFSDIYTTEAFQCQPGAEEMSGKVLCRPPNSTNMLYLFTGRWDGPDAQLPPTDTLHSWALESIIWKP